MTEIQKVEFDLLKLLIEVCNKLNIKYYLVCGSALGAVKYKGFIPWDDDMDVGLLRKDYEKFLKQAPQYLPDYVFLQNYKTDPYFPLVYSKLRNSDTTFIEENVENLSINHGVYIDIFPLDGYPKGKIKQNVLRIRKKIFTWKFSCALNDKNNVKKIRIRNKIFRLLGYHKRTAKTLCGYEKCISEYSPENSEIWCNHGNWQGELEYANRRQYGEGLNATFEGIEVRIPENYDEYLTQKYGEWRKDLPKEKQCSHHYYKVCDLNTSYTEYMK